uniref:Cysteine synthase family protein n=1 Tax=Thermofilum pendens TaxID=2269 RepID=A0A7C3WJH3_THEPE
MPKAEEGVVGLIGCTPLVKLRKVAGGAPIFVKLEYMNPTGSHKDRVALYMIREAERRGLLEPGDLVVEASSGNTALSVAWLASQLGYRALIVVEEGVSPAKVALIRTLGAEVVFAPKVPWGHPDHAVKLAERLAAERGGVFLNQFENEANVKAHYETTGPEICRELGDSISAFVMGIGTGGTIAGVAKFLRERGVRARIVGVVPRGSPIATGQQTLGEPIEGLSTSLCVRNLHQVLEPCGRGGGGWLQGGLRDHAEAGEGGGSARRSLDRSKYRGRGQGGGSPWRRGSW